MKLKNILLSGLSLVLVAALAIGGTVAYLQDSDSDVNVMTLGNVSIRQNEEQRVDPSKNGTLTEDDIEDFEQAKPIYPYVDVNLNGAMGDDYEEITFPNGKTNKLFIGDNAIDKFVSVTNTGKTDAYVRTIIALEAPTDKIDLSFNSTDWEMDKTASSYSIEVDGVKYDLFVCVYKNALKPGETTPYSLMQIILDGTATNEDAAAYGNTYDVLVLSQAVQTAGFADAKTALNAGFGDITTTNHPWAGEGNEPIIPVIIDTVEELQAALDSATGDAVITLAADITGNVVVTQKEGVNITIDGNGYKYTGTIEIYGQARHNGSETLTIQNVSFVANETMDFISCNTTESAKRYAHNVTIQNCSFTGNNAEVMGARFRQCYNITMKDCTAEGMYGIMWATGGNGLVVDNVVATNCKNGISVGTTTPVTIKNCQLNVREYGVRADNAVTMTLENNTISAKQPVIVRKLNTAGLVLNLSGNTLTATGTDNYQVVLTTGSDDVAYVAPSVNYTLTGANGVVIFK